MLLEFMAQNFRSLNAPIRVGMISSRIKELPEHKILLPNFRNKIYANKLAVLFGHNASGKTNVLRALLTMRSMVNRLGISSKKDKELPAFYDPFALNSITRQSPTLFQATYIFRDQYFRYGFKYNSNEIQEEWLISGSPQNENPLLIRTGKDIEFFYDEISSADKNIFIKQIAPNILFLSVGADLEISPFIEAASFFNSFYHPVDKEMPLALSLKDDQLVQILARMLYFADIGIKQIERQEVKNEFGEIPPDIDEKIAKLFNAIKDLAEDNPQFRESIVFKHSSSDITSSEEWTLREEEESKGTKAFLRLLFSFCQALKNNSITIIDEVDESLHPLLLARALQFFTSFDSEAQLICTSHSPVIFSTKVVRRDELIIVEKDNLGETILKRASDFKDARNDGNLTSRYLEGRFGGVPLFNNNLLQKTINEVKQYLTNIN